METRSLKFLAILILIVSFPINVIASEIPTTTDNINIYDEMEIISEETANIVNSVNIQLYNNEKSKKAQIMIATIENLDGQNAFDYSVDFFNTVTIGNKDEDNGVLILLAKDEKIPDKTFVEIRIGYGLEGALTDGKVGRIIDSAMGDLIREGDLDEALRQGFLELASEVDKEYGGVLSEEIFDGFTSTVETENNKIIIIAFSALVIISLVLILLSIVTGDPMYIDILLTLLRIVIGSSNSSSSERGGGKTGGGGAGR